MTPHYCTSKSSPKLMTESSVNWPLNIDFTAAIQNPQVCFRDRMLQQSQVMKNLRGRVTLWSGNFATVYKLFDQESNWAVRCFTRVPQVDVQKRYAAISDHLMQHQLPYLVDFEFIEQGILVKGEWFPALKMAWVEGVELDRYIGEHVNDPEALMVLNHQLRQLKQDLREVGIAHGDLQHGNIMVTAQGHLKLVDYDGMYVPALKGKPPVEIGHPNYQLPERSLSDFNEAVDDFSFDVISLSLNALAQQPALWDSFHEDNKNLIFRQDDFKQPEASPVFQSIAQINDPETQILYAQLVRRCSSEISSGILSAVDRGQMIPVRLATWLSQSIDLPKTSQLQMSKWSIGSLFAIVVLGLGIFALVQDRETFQPVLVKLPDLTEVLAANPLQPVQMTREQLLKAYKDGKRDFSNVNLSGVVLSGAMLKGINLSNSLLIGTSLVSANLNHADLSGAVLTDANLIGVDLTDANLNDANLKNARLREAKLIDASLLRANLSNAKLSYALLQNAQLMKANLTNADLSRADLRSADLVMANLQDANLLQANLQETNLTAANLTAATLESAKLLLADLNSADLSQTNLSRANLSSADLSAANLVDTKLEGANLNYADFSDARVGHIPAVEDASFTNVQNLSDQAKDYLCRISSGAFTDRKPTRDSLGCR